MRSAPSTPIASRANPRVKQLRAAFAGSARLNGGLVAIEGDTLVQEALRSGLALNSIFLTEGREPPPWLPANVECIQLTAEVFASAVDTQSPQGIAALVAPPTWTLAAALAPPRLNSAPPLLLLAAAVQDPGNLGTLIRSAEAFGAHAVLTTPGTVSQWNQKALRASSGSVFRVPVVAITPACIPILKSLGIRLLAAVADAVGQVADASGRVADAAGRDADAHSPQPLPVAETALTLPSALMIGNEGAGLAQEWLALADACITVPTPGGVESLNAAVAGSVLLYEASRQREASRRRASPLTTPHPPLPSAL